jgi:hypothetical protein
VPAQSYCWMEVTQTDTLVFGLGLNPKLDRVWVAFRGENGWWHPAKPTLTPLVRAAVAALERSPST